MHRTSQLRALGLSLLVLACGPDTTTSEDPGTGGSTSPTTPTESEPEPGSTGTTGPAESEWPRRVTLETPGLVDPSPAIHLADGTLDDTDGDLRLHQTMVLTLRSPTAESVCTKGTFANLTDIPTTVDDCPGTPSTPVWHDFAYLSAATIHTTEESSSIGLGLLVRDAEHSTLYRMRILGDSYSADTGRSTVTFDYEPVSPAP